MIEHVLGHEGRESVVIEFQNDRLDTGTDGEPERAVHGLPVGTVGEEEKGNGGDINECEFPVFETFYALQPFFAGAFGKPNDDRRQQGEHVDKIQNDNGVHKTPL